MQAYRVFQYVEWGILIANIDKILTKYSNKILLVLIKDFVFQRMFINFSNFLLWVTYPSVVIHHEQCIFIIYNSAGRERNNFQQLSKLIELKFIPTTKLIELNLFKLVFWKIISLSEATLRKLSEDEDELICCYIIIINLIQPWLEWTKICPI